MLSREERILSELLVERGLLAREVLERRVGERAESAHGVPLAEMLVRAGDLTPEVVEVVSGEARQLEQSLAADFKPGFRFGEFRLTRSIGRGAMGAVYEAEQVPLGRRVALKVLPAAAALDERLALRFLRESRAVARLRHPGIVPVFASGQADGAMYFAMELVEGGSLAERLARGPLPAMEAARIAADVAHALDHAHGAGLIHRDVKPENILLDADGRARLTDFGLVHDVQAGALTQSRQVLGTLAYAAPEQLRGKRSEPRSDVYGAGAVLYTMLAGRPPYEEHVPAVLLRRVLTAKPPALSSLAPGAPATLVRICERAMARDVEHRYPSARAFAESLEGFLRGEESSPGEKRIGRGWSLAAAGIAAAATLAAGLFWTVRNPGGGGELEGADPPWWNLVSRDTVAIASPTHVGLSPDGSRLIYSAPFEALYVQPLGGAPVVVAAEGGRADLSPDGQSIARCEGGLQVIGIADRASRRIEVDCSEAVWSPNGRKIAAVVGQNRRLAAVDVASGEARVVTSQWTSGPRWSPSGQRIAYGTPRAGGNQVWTLPSGGGRPVPVSRASNSQWRAEWSHDGKFLYFGSDRDGGADLWRVRLDEDTGEPLGPEERVTRGLTAGFGLAAARAAPRIALYYPQVEDSLFALALDPVRGVAEAVPKDLAYLAADPDVSPRGDRLVRVASDGTLQAVLLATGRVRNLTNHERSAAAPRWSPDGRHIAFHSADEGPSEIWIVAGESGAATRLAQAPEGSAHPVWSPDGGRIACSVAGRGAFVVDAFGDSPDAVPRELPPFPEPGMHFVPSSWSSDGATLAGSARGVVLLSLAEGRYRRLTDRGEHPSWVGDSPRLVFVDGNAIHWVDAVSGAERRLFRDEHGTLAPRISIARDGRTIYGSRRPEARTIWILDPTPLVAAITD